MNRRQLLNLIEQGENINTEFKQRFSTYEKIAKEMIAFANTGGGYLIFGIDDNKSVYGVESEKGETELINETAEKYCQPPINILINYVELEGREIVVVEIAESNNKPHRIQDYKDNIDLNHAQVYVRLNDKSIPAGKEMIKIMQARSNESRLKKYTIGKNEKLVFEYLKNNDTITTKELSKIANISSRRSSRTLINLVRADLILIHSKENGETFFSSPGKE